MRIKNYSYSIQIFSTILLALLARGGFPNQMHCHASEYAPSIIDQASDRALSLQEHLRKMRAKVVLLARVGSDLSSYHIHYSHVAFAVYHFQRKIPKWTVIHLLNLCGSSQSAIYEQGLMNFFLDDVHNFDYQISVPSVDLQDKILKVLHSQLREKLHNPNYSLIAYPFSTKMQNSNQWILEVVTAALFSLQNRAEVQLALMHTHFRPQLIHVNALKRLGAQLFKDNIYFSDHPISERRTNQFSVVSVASIISYLKAQGKLVSNRTYSQ